MFRTGPAAAFALCAMLAAAPLHAQQDLQFKTTKQVSTTDGKPVQLAILGRVTAACQNAPIKISVVRKPLNGTVRAGKTVLKKGAVAKCPDLEPESAVFFYTPNPGFKGKDQVAILAEYDGKRNGELYEISVD